MTDHCEDGPERRREPRRAHRTVVILAYGEREKMEFEEAVMTNCSEHGICIRLNRPLAVGSSFLLKTRQGSPIMLAYGVQRCKPLGDTFDIGAEYGGFIGRSDVTLGPKQVMELLLAM